MGEEAVRKILKNVGLTDKESDVYIFLARHGPLKGLEISKRLKKHKAQVYIILKNLQSKGLVESTLEFPTRFTAVPFEKVIDRNVKAKRDEAAFIENAKTEILSYWKNINHPDLGLSLEKFVVIEGGNKIYGKIAQMITETKSQFSAITTVQGLLRADRFGIFETALNHLSFSKLQLRFLLEFSAQDLNGAKAILQRSHPPQFDFKGRTPDLGTRVLPRMIVRDDEELILFVSQKTEAPAVQSEETCLWTNSKTLVGSFAGVFRDMWQNALGMEEMILELEANKGTPKTFEINDAAQSKRLFEKFTQSAKDEVTILTSGKSLIASAESVALFKKWVENGVAVKIMTPVTSKNLKTANQLLEICEVRQVPTGYMETMLVDGKHLFQFKNPHIDRESEVFADFDHMVYAEDYEYLKRAKTMLDELWKTAQPLSTPAVPTISSSVEAVEPPSKTRWSDYGNTLLPNKGTFGGLTEKEVLNKILTAKRIPVHTLNDPIVFYGSNAMAVVHPPDFLNLPDMILNVNHNNKNSAFGAEDFLTVSLWLPTPKGPAFVPVAMVIDNPEGIDLRKQVWAGTQVAQNFQLVKKDELQVQVQGNTLFASWTMPIPLFAAKYVLPPAYILFEGYGKLVSGISQTIMPSGRKVTKEYNGLEAFVTFFHKASKHAGLVTDGLFARDAITTSIPTPATT
jgi:sugar-specific transcriptional regulator TrmB